ncbi:AraC family transcriptional regulator [Photobacterium piscicola]|uniref:AraC family transcriptional regulator n=1 Tax=Photobacterium piscicola TaxID=1378299 RepID=A0ABU6LFU3_9GAMM|nr:AraC family transcriptional regulator [Photobacterium piscicola]
MAWFEHLNISPQCHSIIIDQVQSLALEQKHIIQCGINYGKEAFTLYRRNPDMHMLLFTLKGRGILNTPAKQWDLQPDHVIYVPPGYENGFDINPNENHDLIWDMAWVMLEQQSYWDQRLPHEITYYPTQSGSLLFQTIGCLQQALCLGYPLADQLSANITEQLCLLVVNRTSPHSPLALQRLERVFQHAKQQLHHPWQVKDLAALYPCSEPHLHRLCQQYYSQAPMARLTHLRMEHAAGLLTTTSWPIQHISDFCGYPNPTNFSTRFKSWSSFSPRQFRSRFQSES